MTKAQLMSIAGICTLCGITAASVSAQATLFVGEADWWAAVQDVEIFFTSSENMALADEIDIPACNNCSLGSILTFNDANTGMSRSFALRNLNVPEEYNGEPVPGGLVYRDQENGLSDDRNISIGDADGWPDSPLPPHFYEDDDFEIVVSSGPDLTAFSFWLVGNEWSGGEHIRLYDGEVEVANLGGIPSVGNGWSVSFLGVISTQPFDRLVFDEDDGGDDIAISDFRFGVTTIPVPDADFNNDGILDCADIDALVVEIVTGTNSFAFDLTGDNIVDTADLDEWRVQGGAVNLPSGNPYLEGDANLDGEVDGLDFIEWNANKFTSEAAWCSGDFNADGLIDGLDFVIWNANKFVSSDNGSAVPEPGTGVLWMAALIGLAALRQR